MIKKIKNLFMVAALAILAMVPLATHADPSNEAAIKQAEKVRLTVPLNVSNTVYTANRYAVASPIDGWVTGLYYVYEGPNAITSGTSAIVVAKIGGVSLTTISITVPSGTAVLGTISSTTTAKAVSTTGDVTRGQVIEFAATGSPVMSGNGYGRLTVEITPNYTPARFRQ